jgi:hydrogenase maturation protein HypF
MKFLKITVRGIVQGVGFRTFVHRIARENHISGYVKNLGTSVEIDAEGDDKDVESFVGKLRVGPPLSRIDSVESHACPEGKYGSHSEERPSGFGVYIPPDAAFATPASATKDTAHHDYWLRPADCGCYAIMTRCPTTGRIRPWSTFLYVTTA